jgi:amino-acid N-acetyltransferase
MIRLAEPQDLPAVLAQRAEAKHTTESVAEHFPSFFVMDEGGRIVASAGIERHGDAVLLRSLAVAPDARRSGVGAAVLRRALHEVEGRRGGVYALTTTAEGYLARFGFERVSRASLPRQLLESRELRDACPDSATVMRWAAATRS